MRKVHVITEGALILAIFLVLMLFALYAPIIGTILHLVLPLPFILFTIRHGIPLSIMMLIAGSILSILFGSATNILIAFIFGLSGLTMGYFYKRKSPMGALIGGSLAYTFSFVITYIGAILFLKLDFIKVSIGLLEESIEQSKSIITALDANTNVEQQFEQMEKGLELIHTLTPTIFVTLGILFALFSHLVAIPVLKRLKVEVSPLKPFRDLRLPISLIWYYLIVSVLIMIKLDKDSFYFMALINLYYILQFCVLIQGYSFIYYYSYKKGLSKAIPVIAVIASFLLPIFLYLVRILGIIDLCFPLRDKITKK
ncbi:YybS family protein [Metabacillus bambusae]|uniref:YybS family protein n=1 Tax=Metabacillus bambusae TaxID=2795218 RepID=A0ABS3NAJ0_9BACI|nr:YybS family protein [Metabacillus bambusae]MBO1514943.1 YybS family protein [Metabacillus bambusae]